jgi:hypothetical protein
MRQKTDTEGRITIRYVKSPTEDGSDSQRSSSEQVAGCTQMQDPGGVVSQIHNIDGVDRARGSYYRALVSAKERERERGEIHREREKQRKRVQRKQVHPYRTPSRQRT